ncbi:MAG: hypothetical protein M3N52_03330, partial [Actinomycetota bacterium]|nr:hypothetical protein [Actinomycetota bacterium]
LEVAVREAVAHWRAGRLELPDFYLLLDVDDWPPTRRHFYLGFLHRHAPVRVLPCAGTPEAAGRAISSLRAGRWWPGLDRLLADVEQAAPDQLLPPDTGTAALAAG